MAPTNLEYRPRYGIENFIYLVACLGGICSSIVSIVILLGDAGMFKAGSSGSFPSLPTRRASTYINLGSINYTNSKPFPPITSFAQVVLQADLQSSQKSMSEDHRSYYSSEGVVYPNDRHILATPDVCIDSRPLCVPPCSSRFRVRCRQLYSSET